MTLKRRPEGSELVAMVISGGRALLTEGTADTKVPRQRHAWPV